VPHNRRQFGLAAIAALITAPHSLRAAMTPPKTHVIEIKGAEFVPATITLSAGDSITWINRDIVPHTATATDESWDTGILQTGQQYTQRFESVASGDYFCRLHPGMRARLQFADG
jgi:plastocyanin